MRTLPKGVSTSTMLPLLHAPLGRINPQAERGGLGENHLRQPLLILRACAITRSSDPGRFFFIYSGESDTSSAPASISRSIA